MGITDDDWEAAKEDRRRTATPEDLMTDAIDALSALFAYHIRREDDPDTSGPEDQAVQYSEAVIDAAIKLFSRSDFRDLPIHIAMFAAPSDPDDIVGKASRL